MQGPGIAVDKQRRDPLVLAAAAVFAMLLHIIGTQYLTQDPTNQNKHTAANCKPQFNDMTCSKREKKKKNKEIE